MSDLLTLTAGCVQRVRLMALSVDKWTVLRRINSHHLMLSIIDYSGGVSGACVNIRVNGSLLLTVICNIL